MQAAIEARAVSHRTRAGEVTFRDISLTVGHGELVAITGGADSGASTLLDAMSGLRPPTSGTVVHEPGARGPEYVSSGDSLHPALPLGRALRYAAALRAVPGADAAGDAPGRPGADRADAAGADVTRALAAAGLAGRAAAGVGALLPGERRRAAIARALLAGPAELFLDEPTAGLDPAQAAEVLRLLRRLADQGLTVVLTTSSPLDAARCDKVAVLATGGHLAFFGTPEGALGYFGADSLEEIYERLAGLGDPVAAWSRRFFPFPGNGFSGFPGSPLSPPVPGSSPAPGSLIPGPRPTGLDSLVPDAAGPHSAGRVSGPSRDDLALDDPAWDDADLDGRGPAARSSTAAATAGRTGPSQRGRLVSPLRQLPVLAGRGAAVLARSPAARAVLGAAPAAILLAFALLIGAGAVDSAGAGLALPVLGGFGIGAAYGLLQPRGEPGVLRAERFAGLSPAAYVAARLAVLLPPLAAADAVALAVPAAWGRLPHGYGPAYLTMLLGSAVALALATACSSFTAALPTAPLGPPPAAGRGAATVATVAAALWRPALLLAGAVLTLLDRPSPADWLALAALAVAAAVAAAAIVSRRIPACAAGLPP